MNAQLKEVWYVIETADGKWPVLTQSLELAVAKRVIADHECPSMAPHRIVRLVEES